MGDVVRMDAAVANFAFPSATILKSVLLAVKPDVFEKGSTVEGSFEDVVGASSECESLLAFMVKLDYRSSAVSRIRANLSFFVSDVVDYAHYFAYERQRLI